MLAATTAELRCKPGVPHLSPPVSPQAAAAAGAWVEGATVREAGGERGGERRQAAIPLLRRSMDHARMIDARAAALRSRVEELALASFHKDDILAGKTRSHLTAPEQTKVRGRSTALL